MGLLGLFTTTYTIFDLVSITGVSRDTLRAWIEKGILPKAKGGRGKWAYYTDEHRRRIEQIKAFRDENMTLADLYDRFNPIDDDE